MKQVRWIGIALIVVGILGFLTIADDLRHTGELLGVGAVLVCGLLLTGWSLWKRKAL